VTCAPSCVQPALALTFPGLLLKTRLTMYPVALEAVLRAEVALLAQLLAVWTLQRARLVLAVLAHTHARGVSSHHESKLQRGIETG
jgi:hypothetical protein